MGFCHAAKNIGPRRSHPLAGRCSRGCHCPALIRCNKALPDRARGWPPIRAASSRTYCSDRTRAKSRAVGLRFQILPIALFADDDHRRPGSQNPAGNARTDGAARSRRRESDVMITSSFNMVPRFISSQPLPRCTRTAKQICRHRRRRRKRCVRSPAPAAELIFALGISAQGY